MFNYDNELKPRIKRNPCKKGYWKSKPSIQKAFVNRLLINNTVGPSEAKQHKGENHRDQAGETFLQTASKSADRQNLASLEREPKGRNKNPSRSCQTLLSEDDKWVQGLGKAIVSKTWKKKQLKKKNLIRRKRLKDISNQRKETKRQKVPTKNSQAYDCRHQHLRSKNLEVTRRLPYRQANWNNLKEQKRTGKKDQPTSLVQGV